MNVSPKQVSQHQLFQEVFEGATKIPSEDKTIFGLCYFSLAMRPLIPPLPGLQMKYSQEAKMYSAPSYRGTNSEASTSLQCAETGGSRTYPLGRSPWSQPPSWEAGVSSGSLQTAEQEEEEKACLCSCTWKCSM